MCDEGRGVGPAVAEKQADGTVKQVSRGVYLDFSDAINRMGKDGVSNKVHPTYRYKEHTVANAVTKYILDTNQEFKIRFINRIDMNTSNLLP